MLLAKRTEMPQIEGRSSYPWLGLCFGSLVLLSCAPADEGPPQQSGNDSPAPGKSDFFFDDDRRDIADPELSPELREAARAVALVAEWDELDLAIEPEHVLLKNVLFGPDRDLCEDQRFYHQPTVGFCTAFLVAPDIVVTAGHCLGSNGRRCGSAAFVFDYRMDSDSVTEVPLDSVYACDRVLADEYVQFEEDWAVIRLDRPVRDREPLALRSSGRARVDDELVVVGHPRGLPLKAAPNGQVIEAEPEKLGFDMTADVESVNSGSPLLDPDTLKVQGIAIAASFGSYSWQSGCGRVEVCDEVADDGWDCVPSTGTHVEAFRERIPGETSASGEADDIVDRACERRCDDAGLSEGQCSSGWECRRGCLINTGCAAHACEFSCDDYGYDPGECYEEWYCDGRCLIHNGCG